MIIVNVNELCHEPIGKIERDLTTLDRDVAEIVGAAATDLAGMPLEEAVLQMESCLKDAERIRGVRNEEDSASASLEKNRRFEDPGAPRARLWAICRGRPTSKLRMISRPGSPLLRWDARRALGPGRHRRNAVPRVSRIPDNGTIHLAGVRLRVTEKLGWQEVCGSAGLAA